MEIETRTEARGGVSLMLDVLTQPAEAFRYLAQHNHLGLALIVYAVSQLPLNFTPPLPFSADIGDLATAPPATVRSVLVDAIYHIIGLFIFAAPLHLVARLLGGHGRYGQILQAMGLASLPAVFVAPFAVVAHLAELPFVYFLAVLAAVAWSLWLTVVAIRETYKFSTGRAVAALALDVAAFVVVIFVLGVLLSLALLAAP
ncbi:MAG: Yip1 family protein [Bacillota bacterium]|nr:hypothetical protein [Bacillota bacterium]